MAGDINKVTVHVNARKRVAKEVLDQILKGLGSGELTVEQARAIAAETLATLTEIEKHEDLVLEFYRKLAENYPLFELLYTRIKAEFLKARELAEHKAALTAIEAGDMAEAMAILNKAIEETANETTKLK